MRASARLVGVTVLVIAFAFAATPGASGAQSASPTRDASAATAAAPLQGWLTNLKGVVAGVGPALNQGDLRSTTLNVPVIAVAARPRFGGYWMTALDGGVFSFGGAPFLGSLGAVRLNRPVVGIAATPTGHGYWLVAADGGIFSFGDARFFGSTGAIRLRAPVVAMASTPSGRGYRLVAEDGGVFTFGDARFLGSAADRALGAPISTFVSTPSGGGYWLLDRSGGVYPFGDAHAHGVAPVGAAMAVAIVPSTTGNGYWIAATDGTVRSFGDAGVAPAHAPLAGAVVGLATPWASSSGFATPLIEFLSAVVARPTSSSIKTWVTAGEVALTFDDGPSAYTASVLDMLRLLGIPATFFAVGQQVVGRPETVRAELAAGMAVGDHSWDHADLTRLSPAAVVDDIRHGSDALLAATGLRPVCFRPPYGSTNPGVAFLAAHLGLTQILWNVDPSDYQRPGVATIVDRVLAGATGRGLVVGIHDGGGDRSQTIAALPGIVAGLHARGYTFVRLC